MTTAQIITIAGNVCALIITALLMAGGIIGVNLKERINRRFLAMLLFTFAGSIFEIVLALMTNESAQTTEHLILVADFADFTCASCVIISFSLYLYEFISSKMNVPIKPFIIGIGLSALNIPLAAVKDIALAFDSENGYTQISVQVSTIIPIVCVFISIVLTLRYIQFRAREWVSLLLYPIIPVLGAFVQYFIPGIWLSYLGVSISLFIIYMNIQAELGRRVLEQELELSENRISLMLSQIQPHFLYNSLTAIHKLCSIDIEKAKSAVNDFAHYLRGNLESLSRERMIPFDDEMEHVETYLSLEKLRFGDKLNIIYDVEATDFMIPPLTVQPIVENAVRHGIVNKDGGGTVTIRVTHSDFTDTIVVEDDGVGFDPAELKNNVRTHVGIQNVRERLGIQCGGILEVESVPGCGARAVISIPKKKEEIL